MSDVTPIHRKQPVLVEPGQTPSEADWQAGWRACRDTLAPELERAYASGANARPVSSAGVTFTNLAVVSTLTFITGFLVAIAFFAA